MKRHLLSLAVAALAGTAATWAVDYDLSSLGNSTFTDTSDPRYISSLKVKDDAGNPEVTIGPARTGNSGAIGSLSVWRLKNNLTNCCTVRFLFVPL